MPAPPGVALVNGHDGDAPVLVVEVANELYAALHDGTSKHSTDGGLRRTVRSTP
jgi:hypothetical protein